MTKSSKERYAKWDDGIVKTTDFETTADSGYYSATPDAEEQTGEIAFNTFFSKYAELTDKINYCTIHKRY